MRNSYLQFKNKLRDNSVNYPILIMLTLIGITCAYASSDIEIDDFELVTCARINTC